MTQVIIFENDDGEAISIYPTKDAIGLIGIHAIARKDVPAGKTYKIVEDDVEVGSGEAWAVGEGTEWAVIGYLNEIELLVRHNTTGQRAIYTTLSGQFTPVVASQ